MRIFSPLVIASLWFCVGCRQPDEPKGPDESANDSVKEARQLAAKESAESADDAARRVVAAFQKNQLGIVWNALPQSYRQDINELARAYAESMDIQLWNRLVSTMKKAVKVLKTKKGLFLGSQFVEQRINTQDVSVNWDNMVNLLDTVVNSELSDLQRLKSIDVGDFLAGTGGDVLLQLRTWAALSAESPNPFHRLDQLQIDLVSEQSQTAILRLRSPGEEAREETYVKVEGKWIPQTTAESWTAVIQRAKAGVSKQSSPQNPQQKTHFLNVLSLADELLNELAATETSGQVDIILVAFVERLRSGALRNTAVRPAELVTLVLKGQFTPAVEQHVRALAGPIDFETYPDGEDTIVKIRSASSIEQLANRIRFGTILELDAVKRLIRVQLSE